MNGVTMKHVQQACDTLMASNEYHAKYQTYVKACVKTGWEVFSYAEWFETHHAIAVDRLAQSLAHPVKDHIVLKRVNPAQWDGIYPQTWDADYQATLMTKEKAEEYVANENKDPKRLFDRVAIKVDLPV